MTTTKISKGNEGFVTLLLVLVGLIAVAGVLFVKTGALTVKVAPSQKPNTGGPGQQEQVILPTPTPQKLKQGKETYIYSWGEGTTVPKMGTVTIDPHDPKPTDTQNVTITFTHTAPVDSVNIQVYSDNKVQPFPLTLTSGINTDGTWSGSWAINDTVLYRYDLQFHAIADGKDTPYDVILRGSKP